MYTSFHIQNFRVLDDLTFDNLARINLIAGKNNIGKTSLLEAIFVHCGGHKPELVFSVQTSRGIEFSPDEAVWRTLFNALILENAVMIEGVFDGTKRTLKLETIPRDQIKSEVYLLQGQAESGNGTDTQEVVHASQIFDPLSGLKLTAQIDENPPQEFLVWQDRAEVRGQPAPSQPAILAAIILSNTTPIGERLDRIARRFGQLQKKRDTEFVKIALKHIEPNLNAIEAIPIGSKIILHGAIDEMSELVPFTVMGGGMVHLAEIITTIGNFRDGVLLIDEIETGLHHSIHADVWRSIGEAAEEYNVQIFATTHSAEMIEAANEAFDGHGEDFFRYHRIDRSQKTGKLKVASYDEETLDAAVEMDLEVRG